MYLPIFPSPVYSDLFFLASCRCLPIEKIFFLPCKFLQLNYTSKWFVFWSPFLYYFFPPSLLTSFYRTFGLFASDLYKSVDLESLFYLDPAKVFKTTKMFIINFIKNIFLMAYVLQFVGNQKTQISRKNIKNIVTLPPRQNLHLYFGVYHFRPFYIFFLFSGFIWSILL